MRYTPSLADADVGPSDGGSVDGGVDGRADAKDSSVDISHPSGTVLDPDGIVVEHNACTSCRRPTLGCSQASRLLIWGEKGEKHLRVSRLDKDGKTTGEADILGPFSRIWDSAEIAAGPDQYLMTLSDTSSVLGLPATADGLFGDQIVVGNHSPLDLLGQYVAFNETVRDYFVVWTESYTYSSNIEIRAARVSTKGDVRSVSGSILNEGSTRAIACAENCLVVWNRGYDEQRDIYGTIVKGSGQFEESGIPIAAAAGVEESSPAIATGAGGFLVVWATDRGISGAYLNGDGTERHQTYVADTSVAVVPSVVSSGDTFFVVWADESVIYGARLDNTKTLDVPPIVISEMSGENSGIDLCFDGTNYLAAWLNRSTEETPLQDIYVARIVP